MVLAVHVELIEIVKALDDSEKETIIKKYYAINNFISYQNKPF